MSATGARNSKGFRTNGCTGLGKRLLKFWLALRWNSTALIPVLLSVTLLPAKSRWKHFPGSEVENDLDAQGGGG
jgi:hypothetical protein